YQRVAIRTSLFGVPNGTINQVRLTASGPTAIGFYIDAISFGPRLVVPESQLFREFLRLWLPPAFVDWWGEREYLNSASQISAVDLLELRDVPVPVDTWDVFDALFAWDARPISESSGRCDTALGAAVRSFFAQGGRKCYVVRLGDPWTALA